MWPRPGSQGGRSTLAVRRAVSCCPHRASAWRGPAAFGRSIGEEAGLGLGSLGVPTLWTRGQSRPASCRAQEGTDRLPSERQGAKAACPHQDSPGHHLELRWNPTLAGQEVRGLLPAAIWDPQRLPPAGSAVSKKCLVVDLGFGCMASGLSSPSVGMRQSWGWNHSAGDSRSCHRALGSILVHTTAGRRGCQMRLPGRVKAVGMQRSLPRPQAHLPV